MPRALFGTIDAERKNRASRVIGTYPYISLCYIRGSHSSNPKTSFAVVADDKNFTLIKGSPSEKKKRGNLRKSLFYIAIPERFERPVL
jgi:hypothetical protein